MGFFEGILDYLGSSDGDYSSYKSKSKSKTERWANAASKASRFTEAMGPMIYSMGEMLNSDSTNPHDDSGYNR